MKGIIILIVAGLTGAMTIGCAPQVPRADVSETGATGKSAQMASQQDSADKYLIVNCRYSPRIRTTGGLVTQIPRRPERVTREQCLEQNGRPVSAPKAWGNLAKQGDTEAQIHLGDY